MNYKNVMIELQKIKCKHIKNTNSNSAMCTDCYLEIIKDKVNNWRNKTYIIKNDI